MKTESLIRVRADRMAGALLGGLVVTAAAGLLMLAPAGRAAGPGSGPDARNPQVTLESVPGSSVPRVILSARAAERLGIEVGKVSEESVERKQMVGGLVVPPLDKPPESKPGGGLFGGLGRGGASGMARPVAAAASSPQPGAAPAGTPVAGEVWVLVTLSPAEYERLAKDKPARLLPLPTRAHPVEELLAEPSGMQPFEDLKRSMLSLYYKVPGKDHGLALNNRMRVELQLAGEEVKQKAVPYSAVYYDAKGNAWVYVNTKPLTFERQRIAVDRVVGDMALLSEGPAVGTPVVTVGAALLYGAEIFKK